MKNTKETNKNTFSYAFKQQILRAWQPVPTLQSTVTIFFILGLIFLAFGIAIILLSQQVHEFKVRYDDTCKPADTMVTPCTVTIDVTETMKAPVFFYYQLNNFYQNHRRYLNSRDSDQLSGTVKTVDQLDSCDPIKTNGDAGKTVSYGGVALASDGPANPCGLVAKSVFNDTYAMSLGTTTIPINENGIAWESDVKNKFKLPENSNQIQWIDVTNEHFIVWMRTAATPDFRKLWGRIEQDLQPGTYTIVVTNLYDVSGFDGEKKVILSTANTFGGKNQFLGIAYLVVGSLAIVIAILFLIKDRISPPKNLPKFD